MIWKTGIAVLMYSSVVMVVLRVSVYVLSMATLVELQKEIREGLAVRRPSYPEGRFVWDRGDGLLVTSGHVGNLTAKAFSLEEIVAVDWEPVALPMFMIQRRLLKIRVPEFHRRSPPKVDVLSVLFGPGKAAPMRDITALVLALLIVGGLGLLLHFL